MKKIVPYEESFGAYTFPAGFEETLKGKTIEQQMDCYRLTMSVTDANTDWRERTHGMWYVKLDRVSDVRALIVHGDTLVGILVEDDNGREVPCFADERVCTYYAQDNNGAGYKERDWYRYLICLPADHTLW